MSQLSQLKQQINGIGNDAKSTAQGLSGFKSKFSQSVKIGRASCRERV